MTETVSEQPGNELQVVPTKQIQIYSEHYDIPESEIERIANIYFKHLFKQALKKRNRDNAKVPLLKREAILIAAFAIRCSKETFREYTTHKTAEDIINVVRLYLGIDKIQEWIDSQGPKAELILRSSGRARQVRTYLDLRVTLETEKMFKHPQKFRDTVNELFDWLRIVAVLNQQTGSNAMVVKLAGVAGADDIVWNKGRVYLTLVIGAILGIASPSFKIADILQLCDILRKNEWKEQVVSNLKTIVIGANQMTLADDEMIQQIIEDLENQKNQTLFYFAKRVLFEYRNENEMLDEAHRHMIEGMKILSYHDAIGYNKRAHKIPLDLIRRVTSVLRTKPMEIAHVYMLEHPYFFPWLQDNEVFRLAIWDMKHNASLAEAVKPYDPNGRFMAMFGKLNERVTTLEVIDSILEGKDLLGVAFGFFTKNKSMEDIYKTPRKKKKGGIVDTETSEIFKVRQTPKSLTNTLRDSMTKTIMTRAVLDLSSEHLLDWMQQVENAGHTVDVKLIPRYRILALYFSGNAEKRAKSISGIVEAYPWIKYIDQYALDYFRSRADMETERKLKPIKK